MKTAQLRAAKRISSRIGGAHQWVVDALGLASRAELKRLTLAVEELSPRAKAP